REVAADGLGKDDDVPRGRRSLKLQLAVLGPVADRAGARAIGDGAGDSDGSGPASFLVRGGDGLLGRADGVGETLELVARVQRGNSDTGRRVEDRRVALAGCAAHRSLPRGGCLYSAVVGSMTRWTRATELAGKLPARACCRTASSFGATYTQ